MDGTYAATLYLHAFLRHSRACQLYFLDDEYAIKDLKSKSGHYFESIRYRGPDSGLVSSFLAGGKESLKRNATRPTLELLIIDGQIEGFESFKPFIEVLPPMEELQLRNYACNHPKEEWKKIWNFSRLRTLALENAILRFLENAPMDQLTQLESLSLDLGRYSDDWDLLLPGLSQEHVHHLFGRLLTTSKNLKSLKVVAEDWTRLMKIENAINLGSELVELALHTNNDASDIYSYNTIPVYQTNQLRKACPNLRYLGLNLDTYSAEASTPILLVPLENLAIPEDLILKHSLSSNSFADPKSSHGIWSPGY